MKKVKKYVVKNKKIFIFLSILVLIAITAGSIFSVTISSNDAELVKNYLANYITSINNNELIMLDSFLSSIINNFSLVFIVFLLGISFIGIPIIIIIFFYKSFIFGFTLGSILVNYKIKGILLSIIYMFPHNIIDIFVLIIYVVISINLTRNIIKSLLKKEPINTNIIKRYIKITLQVLIVYLVISVYSSYVVPLFIKAINISKL